MKRGQNNKANIMLTLRHLSAVLQGWDKCCDKWANDNITLCLAVASTSPRLFN